MRVWSSGEGMRVYYPASYELAEMLAGTVLLSCGVLHAGAFVCNSEPHAMKMMAESGACFVLELSADYFTVGAERFQGKIGWYKLAKQAPIAEVLYQDIQQFLVDRGERLLLGKPNTAGAPPGPPVERLPPAVLKPDAKALVDFRIMHGRSPSNEELRTMMKRRG
jgi:hypothetical protein